MPYQRSMSLRISRSLRFTAPSRRFSSTVRSTNVPRPCGTWAMPCLRHRLGASPPIGRAGEGDLALDRDHAADGPERGGLAGAVGAEHHDDLALLDLEVDAVQHLHRAVPAVHRPSARAAPSGGSTQVGLDHLRVVADRPREDPRRSSARSRGRRCGRRWTSPWPCGARPAGSSGRTGRGSSGWSRRARRPRRG